MRKCNKYPLDFKREIVSLVKDCPHIPQLARELGLYKNQLYKWRIELGGLASGGAPNSSAGTAPSREKALETENAKLKGALAEKVLELDFFNMGATLPLAALQRAIELRAPLPGLVHHSDRGVQYCCREYAAFLREHQITPSVQLIGSVDLLMPEKNSSSAPLVPLWSKLLRTPPGTDSPAPNV